MKPSLKLRLSRETLRQLQDLEARHVDGGGATLVSCRIVSCALACPTQSPLRCNL